MPVRSLGKTFGHAPPAVSYGVKYTDQTVNKVATLSYMGDGNLSLLTIEKLILADKVLKAKITHSKQQN
jgi:hypothetical protein